MERRCASTGSGDVSRRSREWVAQYVVTRFPVSLFTPLAAFLALCSAAGDRSSGVGRFALRVCVAHLLLFVLRLWDDLADLERDRGRDPGRVLCQAPPGLFPRVLAALLVGSPVASALAARGAAAGLAVAAWELAGAVWYGLLRHRLRDGLLRSALAMGRYPALVLATGAPGPASSGAFARAALAALLAHGALLLFEVTHDGGPAPSMGDRGARLLAVAEVGCAAAALIALGPASAQRNATDVAFDVAWSAAGIALLSALCMCSSGNAVAARRIAYACVATCIAVAVPLCMAR